MKKAKTFEEISDLIFDLMIELDQKHLPKHREIGEAYGSTVLNRYRTIGGMSLFEEYYNLRSRKEWECYELTGEFEDE